MPLASYQFSSEKSWPGAWDVRRAQALGLSADKDFEAIIKAYMEDELV